MKDNRYTRALSGISIDSETLESRLGEAKRKAGKEKNGKVIYMKNWKTAAIAACLAVVVGATAVFVPGHQNKRRSDVTVNEEVKGSAASENSEVSGAAKAVNNLANTFIIKANAEEITVRSKVVIGLLDGVGGGYSELENGNFEIVKHLQFPIICEGTGIESVTYSLPEHSENVQMTFVMQPSFADSVEHNGVLNAGYKTIYMPDTYAASQYTIPFDRLPSAEDFGKRENGHHSDPVILDICFEGDPKDFGCETVEEMIDILEDDDFEKVSAFWAKLYTGAAEKYGDEMKIDITANFEDGTSKTETVRLSCADALPEDDFTKVMVTGIIEE